MYNKILSFRSKDISQYSRPLPYFNIGTTVFERNLAASLRKEFIPKVARRLPDHHLRGFPHYFIVKYVATQKKNYPWFIQMDIEKFYPSIERRELD